MLSFISRSGIFSEIASEIPQSDLCFSEIGCKSKHVNKEQQRFRCQAFHGEEILSKSNAKRSIIQFRHHQTEMLTIHQSNQYSIPSNALRTSSRSQINRSHLRESNSNRSQFSISLFLNLDPWPFSSGPTFLTNVTISRL